MVAYEEEEGRRYFNGRTNYLSAGNRVSFPFFLIRELGSADNKGCIHRSIDVSVRDDGRTRDGGLRHPREIPLVRNKSARLPQRTPDTRANNSRKGSRAGDSESVREEGRRWGRLIGRGEKRWCDLCRPALRPRPRRFVPVRRLIPPPRRYLAR